MAPRPTSPTPGAASDPTNYVTPIDIATNTAGTPIPARGNAPIGIAITPDGTTAYVTNNTFSNSVTPIDIATNTAGTPFAVGMGPVGIAITPDGATAYVANSLSDDLTPIDTATNTTAAPFAVAAGSGPWNIAIVPNQAPAAAFSTALGDPDSDVLFDATGSADPDGSIDRYDWDFGDGATLDDGGPTPSHSYEDPGSYDVTLTVTDSEGCSTELIFSGQTAYCNGKPSAEIVEQVAIPATTVDGSAAADGTQSQKRNRIAVTVVVVAGEDLTAQATGEVEWRETSYELKPRTKRVAAGKSKKLKLKLKGKDGKRIARALTLGEQATAKLTVDLTDRAGNEKSEQLTVILKD